MNRVGIATSTIPGITNEPSNRARYQKSACSAANTSVLAGIPSGVMTAPIPIAKHPKTVAAISADRSILSKEIASAKTNAATTAVMKPDNRPRTIVKPKHSQRRPNILTAPVKIRSR